MDDMPAITVMTVDNPEVNQVRLSDLRRLVAEMDRRQVTDDAAVLWLADPDHRVYELWILGGREACTAKR